MDVRVEENVQPSMLPLSDEVVCQGILSRIIEVDDEAVSYEGRDKNGQLRKLYASGRRTRVCDRCKDEYEGYLLPYTQIKENYSLEFERKWLCKSCMKEVGRYSRGKTGWFLLLFEAAVRRLLGVSKRLLK